MPSPLHTQVLIAGGGPVGLTAAIELTRRGVHCRVVDPLLEPPLYAKAVGVQPRTLEVFENVGIRGRILDAAIQMRGQLVYVNGGERVQVDFPVPADIPFGFVAIPQYATERILRDELATRGVAVQRGLRLTGFEQDADGVTAALAGDGVEQTVRAQYLRLTTYLVAAPGVYVAASVLPVIRDSESQFAAAYAAVGEATFVVRPDGYLGFVGADGDLDGLLAHLRATFR